MEPHLFNNLLNQVTALNERYKKINELTGENFNVFRILKLESSEVRMHSAFIAELLNPKGSHGQGDIFLKHFIESFCFKKTTIDTANCHVEVEKHTGYLNEQRTEGGRIDILITDRNRNQILIENKIYAGDQDKQLFRYFNHSKHGDLIYLTLEGGEPSEYSSSGLILDEHYVCRSYKHHIASWLESCRKEVATLPIIRESITQYLNLIKYLTNQTLNDTMKDDLATIVAASYENTEAAFTIIHNLEAIREKLLNKFKEDLDEIAKELNFNVTNDFDLTSRYSGVYFYRSNWNRISIAFQFQKYADWLIYGILIDEPESYPNEHKEKLISIKTSDMKTSDYWPLYHDFETPYNNWYNSKEVWVAVANGTMKQEFKHRLIDLINLLDSNAIDLQNQL
ncbi:MAG: hypothetical protein EOO43_02115 [Flavobacterium sp.]|nr:MAG: hypothetical protein EOO43_02115 [Flavobacterium sp.]